MLLAHEDIENQLQRLMGWTYSPQKKCIFKEFVFKDFIQTFALMTQIAIHAEKQNHHPEWTNIYNKLWIELRTHDAQGVTQKDLDLAAYINDKAWEVR